MRNMAWVNTRPAELRSPAQGRATRSGPSVPCSGRTPASTRPAVKHCSPRIGSVPLPAALTLALLLALSTACEGEASSGQGPTDGGGGAGETGSPAGGGGAAGEAGSPMDGGAGGAEPGAAPLGSPCGAPIGKACAEGTFCSFETGESCGGIGVCRERPTVCTLACDGIDVRYCGCDGNLYCSRCDLAAKGLSVSKDPSSCSSR